MKFIAILPLAVLNVPLATASPASQLQKQGGTNSKIYPPLEPVSSPKFMKADYPDDYRSPVYHKFGYPYPTVQDHEDYDKDYVQDKNDGNGYWKAQLDYDAIKNRVEKEKREMEMAYKREQEDAKELASVKAAEALAEKAAQEAEAAEKKADAAHDKAAEKLADAKEEVDEKTDGTEGEITDLEECKKQLAAAKAKLKSLLEEHKGTGANLDGLAKAEDAAEMKEMSAEEKEATLEKKVAEETREHDAALKSVEEEAKDVKKVEDALTKAAAKLRAFRKTAVDPDGGVYFAAKKSGARGTGVALAPLLAGAAAALFAM